jgi:hypothetical protein
MELRIAKVISYIFHPLFIPFYTILVLLNTDSFLSFMIPLKGKILLAGIVLLTTVLLPSFTSLFLIRMKIIQSIFPKTRTERIYLLLNVAIFYYLTYYLLKGTHVSIVFNYFMLGSTFLVICSLIITFFYKISLHMIATGGLLGGLIGLTFLHSVDLTGSILVLILFAGVMGSARLLIIDSQKPEAVYSGFLIGITVMFLLFILI